MYVTIDKIPAMYSNLMSKYGDVITVYRSTGNLSTRGQRVKGRQLLSPFEINFLRFMMFASDSPVVQGDHIKNESTGEEFFISATDLDTAIAVPMNIYTELYMINYPSVEIQRLTQGTVDDNGNRSSASTWNTVSTVPMNVEHITGNTQYKDDLYLPEVVFKLTMQTTAGLQLEDRVVLDGKSYQVADVNLSMIQGLQIVRVKVDERK